MQWRRRHCCPAKMTWTVKRSLFRTHVAGLLSLALLFTAFLFFSHQDWLPGRNSPRENPLSYTMRGFRSPRADGGQNSSLRSMLKDGGLASAAKPSLNLSSQQSETASAGGNSGHTLGLGDAMSANNSLQKEMDVGGKLSAQPFRYILNEPHKCKDSTPFLILLVVAEPAQIDARNAIRQTWGNESAAMGLGFVRLFLLGTGKSSAKESSLQSQIEKESRTFHDIIQQDYQDTYYNLTIKTLMGMNWVATFCPRVAYVMKTDSDMFVNTEYLIQKLLKPDLPPKQRFFTGVLMRDNSPIRNIKNKWFMPEEQFPGKRYPTFCSGTGYVFSGDVAALIYQVSLEIPKVRLEDVYVGMCLAKLQIEPQPPPKKDLFNHWKVPFSVCKYRKLITSHHLSPHELLKHWKELQSKKDKPC